MTSDELQAAIERAESKRRELSQAMGQTEGGAKIISMLPRAAERYRKQIAQGLEGDAGSTDKARAMLRELIPNRIRRLQRNGGLVAKYGVFPEVLLKGAGTDGRGDRI